MTRPDRGARRASGLLAATATAIALCALPVLAAPAPAAAPTACVEGTSPSCFATLQQALDAASSGGTIRLSAGQFAGGVVRKDVTVLGAGSAETVVSGGGPVVRIESTRSFQPTVDLESLSITGGIAHGDSREPGTVNANGGGLLILPRHGKAATVHLRHVVVSGNQTAPTQTSPSPSGVRCPHADCPYAGSYGGGIANYFGELWLEDSQVVDNTAGGRASDANGGGIFSFGGSLHLLDSTVSGNRSAPLEIGRFAEGGGVHVTGGGSLDVRRTVVSDNTAELVTSWPVRARGTVIEMNANSGGIHVGDGSRVKVVASQLTGNTARTVDPDGEPAAFDSAMLVGDSRLTMRRCLVARNVVEARVATSKDAGFSGTAIEVDRGPATITRTQIVDNTATAFSRRGVAGVSNGLAVYNFTDGAPAETVLRHVLIAHNSAVATSPHGTATAQGAGVLNNSLLRMVDVLVSHNQARALAPDATAQGGGIWNGPLLSGPPVRLVMRDVRVIGNAVSAPHGVRQGGGIYSSVPFVGRTVIVQRNQPDQCVGCG